MVLLSWLLQVLHLPLKDVYLRSSLWKPWTVLQLWPDFAEHKWRDGGRRQKTPCWWQGSWEENFSLGEGWGGKVGRRGNPYQAIFAYQRALPAGLSLPSNKVMLFKAKRLPSQAALGYASYFFLVETKQHGYLKAQGDNSPHQWLSAAPDVPRWLRFRWGFWVYRVPWHSPQTPQFTQGP